jgi:hypothetical protein
MEVSRADPAHMTRLGVYFLDITTSEIPAGTMLQFTFQWGNGQWEGPNFSVAVCLNQLATDLL